MIYGRSLYIHINWNLHIFLLLLPPHVLLFNYHFIVGFDNLKISFVFLFLQTSFKRPSPEPFENEILKSTAKKGGKAAATKMTKKKKRDPNEPQK